MHSTHPPQPALSSSGLRAETQGDLDHWISNYKPVTDQFDNYLKPSHSHAINKTDLSEGNSEYFNTFPLRRMEMTKMGGFVLPPTGLAGTAAANLSFPKPTQSFQTLTCPTPGPRHSQEKSQPCRPTANDDSLFTRPMTTFSTRK